MVSNPRARCISERAVFREASSSNFNVRSNALGPSFSTCFYLQDLSSVNIVDSLFLAFLKYLVNLQERHDLLVLEHTLGT